MLKNKLFFFYFFIFAFYFESFAMRENVSGVVNEENNSNVLLGFLNENRPKNMLNIGDQGGKKEYQKGPKKQFNKPAHVFFYFVLSPLLNVNNLDWRCYFFRGKINNGGVFFYYGFLNFGLGFNKKTFWDKCSCRIIGVNIFQFLGSFVLYFFVDKREKLKERWAAKKESPFLFFLFSEEYLCGYVDEIVDRDTKIADIVYKHPFAKFVSYSFAIFPFLSFLTFDFQFFEYLTFSLNIGSFLFLSITFFIYTFWKYIEGPFGKLCNNFSPLIKMKDNTDEEVKGKPLEL